ncbi:MAG: flagellar hook-basal body complex protein [Alphaproteobacteria bacterium]
MSFYTALTGLNGAQADISATSNNIANVGTTGFKRSRAEFGDIFATSPLQNSSSSIGSGSILKGVKQQFTQGNIASSLNALDLAISGQGFFALKPSLTSSQVVYTRNGSFNVDNNRNVVDSTGQFLLTYPVNDDGSVTSKSIGDAVPLQLPITSGDPQATANIDLAVNLPADAPVILDNPKFAEGYQFSPNDPSTFTNSTSLTIFDDLGNPTIATVYFIKTQAATADDPTNKYDTRLVIDETVIQPDLVASVDDNGRQLFIDRFGNQTTRDQIPDDNFFLEGKGSPLYRLDDLNDKIPSQPARLTGSQSGFDFGEEGNKLIEITNDPMKFNATREAGNSSSSIYWGKDFLLVNVDDGDVPVSIDLRPGKYNAQALAAEVERAINEAYGDDKKLQVRSNVDDILTVDLFTLNPADGTLNSLATPISVDLLQPTFVSEQLGIDVSGSSPDFTREEFLAHAQVRLNEAMDAYVVKDGNQLGVEDSFFAKVKGSAMTAVFEETEVVKFQHSYNGDTGVVKEDLHLAYSYYGQSPELTVYKDFHPLSQTQGTSDGSKIVYDSANNILTIDFGSNPPAETFAPDSVVRLAGNFGSQNSLLNGRELRVLETVGNTLRIATTGLGFPDSNFTLQDQLPVDAPTNMAILYNESDSVEAYFEGADLRPDGAVNSYNSKKIVLRETQSAVHSGRAHELLDATGVNLSVFDGFESLGYSNADNALTELGFEAVSISSADTNVVQPTVTNGEITFAGDISAEAATYSENIAMVINGIEVSFTVAGGDNPAAVATKAVTAINAALTERSIDGFVAEVDPANTAIARLVPSNVSVTAPADVAGAFTFGAASGDRNVITLAGVGAATPQSISVSVAGVQVFVSIDDTDNDLTIASKIASALNEQGVPGFKSTASGAAGNAQVEFQFVGYSQTTSWVDDLDPPIDISYDAANQRFQFGINHTVLGPAGANYRAFKVFGAESADATNNLGIPSADAAEQVAIGSTAVISARPFVADGPELQINAKRFGVEVEYNSDTKSFTFSSGTTGENIDANGALGVESDQSASNIQVGRYAISTEDGSVVNDSFDTATRAMGLGDNSLMGVGASKNDVIFEGPRGKASQPAQAIGASATEPLDEIFNLSSAGGANIFNVSVNGISGVIEIPPGNYVGSTLAEQLQTRINQIIDGDTGEVVGGVQVQYRPETNNFVFTTGTTGDTSTIKVKGSARLGLDDVPLGVGTVPEIVNLVQATNDAGVPLYVNAAGEIVETPPESLVTDYYPLYLDEGELTFDKTGQLVSPLNRVHYEQQAAGFSISLDVDYSQSTQLAQPFSVRNIEQDGFTSGRLDGLDIDATGLLRANYTNGENKPLGKIVLANFNNQNGLKQIGNATFVETATSGTPTFGEAGAEGFGSIQSGSLERSNVDITEELVNLITAQRNFQASSKAIETSTQLTQTIINIRS